MYIGCSSSYANCVGLKAMNSKYSMQIPSGIPPAMHSEAFIAEFDSSLNIFLKTIDSKRYFEMKK